MKAILVTAVLVGAACGGGGDRGEEGGGVDSTTAVSSAPTLVGDEQAAMTTTDGAVRMALVGDRVVVGLSDSLVGQIRDKIPGDSAGDGGGGALGGFIQGVVKSAVSGALTTKVEYPLSEIEDVSYDGTRLRLVVRGKGEQLDNANVNNRPLLESFRPEDARRFVEAVRQAKGHGAMAR